MAFKSAEVALPLPEGELDARIQDRLSGGADSLKFMDGISWTGVTALNKIVRASVENEQHVLTVASPKFIHGKGVKQVDF